MYYLSKIVWFFLEPSNLLATLILIATMLKWRKMAPFAIFALIFAGLSPIGTLLLRPLEARFPAYADDGKTIAGIIVLGGAVDPEVTVFRGQIALNEAGERVLAMLELARRYPTAKMIFTGGSGELTGVLSEADAVEKVILGIKPDITVLFERKSKNTLENAALTKKLVQDQIDGTWLLVTSAWHMPRSVGLFRKAGWRVAPYPVDYRSTGQVADLKPFLSISNGLRRTDLAVKEWVGLLFAYMSGQSDSIFPSPDR